jgi:hypothetical protein
VLGEGDGDQVGVGLSNLNASLGQRKSAAAERLQDITGKSRRLLPDGKTILKIKTERIDGRYSTPPVYSAHCQQAVQPRSISMGITYENSSTM